MDLVMNFVSTRDAMRSFDGQLISERTTAGAELARRVLRSVEHPTDGGAALPWLGSHFLRLVGAAFILASLVAVEGVQRLMTRAARNAAATTNLQSRPAA